MPPLSRLRILSVTMIGEAYGEQRSVRSAVVAALILGIGLLARLVVFQGKHVEGDEVVYRTLLEQVSSGHGYTLRGLPVIAEAGLNAEIYDQPVFPQHPPGGVLFFLLCDLLTPGHGPATAQVAAFALFCAGMLLMWRAVIPESGSFGLLLVAAACSFSPIAAHVAARHWLDAPLLGFGALGCGLYLLGVAGRRWGPVVAGCACLLVASTVKLTALGIFPWLIVLSFTLAPAAGRGFPIRSAVMLAVAGLAVVIPWQLWLTANDMAGAAAIRPNVALMRTNPFIRFVTSDRSPLIYLTLTPFVLWTLLPSAVMLLVRRRAGRKEHALALWIAGTLLTYVVLGALGYSKLLRYAILVTPASILLFASVTAALWRDGAASGPLRRGLLALAFGGLAFEIAQGVYLTLHTRLDLIVSIAFPLLGTALKLLLGR